MNIAWIICETCMKLNAHFIHKKSSSALIYIKILAGRQVPRLYALNLSHVQELRSCV